MDLDTPGEGRTEGGLSIGSRGALAYVTYVLASGHAVK